MRSNFLMMYTWSGFSASRWFDAVELPAARQDFTVFAMALTPWSRVICAFATPARLRNCSRGESGDTEPLDSACSS